MKKLIYFTFVLLLVIGLLGCSNSKSSNATDSASVTETAADNSVASVTTAPTQAAVTPTAAVVQEENNVIYAEIQSEALAKNIIEDKSSKKVVVYLPPSYYSSDKKYPVVYFLHGYGDSTITFMNKYRDKLDEQFNGEAQEFIMVVLDGNNKTGGSFYVNSPVMGNWEDYVVSDVVTYIDSNYRTIADSASRGISGYSMGGFGALYLSLRHPDVFSSTLVFCPGIFAENDLDSVLKSWRSWTDVSVSYAQAFSPDINNTENYGNLITESDVEAKNSVWEDWMNGYSNWGQKLDDYLALNKPLKEIKIAYATNDGFLWIPKGCEYFAELCKTKNVNYSMESFLGGHIVPNKAIEQYFIPFFGENLTY